MSACLFDNVLAKCTPRVIGQICTSHTSVIFAFPADPKFTHGSGLIEPTLETSVTALSPMQNIPFPFEFERNLETGKILVDKEPKLCEEKLSHMWENFVSRIATAGGSDRDVKRLNIILQTVCKAWASDSPALQVDKHLQDWYNETTSKASRDILRWRWEESFIRVAFVNTKTNVPETVLFPMTLLPIFYQTLFFHAEMSIPNLADDADNKSPRCMISKVKNKISAVKNCEAAILELNAESFELHVSVPNVGGERVYLRGRSS